jgi:hypothetical protein
MCKTGPFEFVTDVILTRRPFWENLLRMIGNEFPSPTDSTEIEPDGAANSLRVHTLALLVLLLLVVGIYFFYLPQ